MAHMTEAQLRLFQANANGKPSSNKRRGAPVLREAMVNDQIVAFMESRGWRCIRLLAGTFKSLDGRRFVVGAPTGIPDRICIRGAEYFLLELKAPGKKLRPKQETWITQARQELIPVIVSDDYDNFLAGYRCTHPNEFVPDRSSANG